MPTGRWSQKTKCDYVLSGGSNSTLPDEGTPSIFNYAKSLFDKRSDIAGLANEFAEMPVFGHVLLGHDALVNIYEWAGKKKATALPPNPLLIPSDGLLFQNTKTAAYFKKRMFKKIAGSGFSAVGSALSSVTQVNALGVARHGRSDAKTIAHLVNLDKLLTQFKGKKLQIEYDLCKLIIDCKILKIESQSAALAADCIPGNLISGALTAVASFAHGQSLALRLSNMEKDIQIAAQLLHYRALHGLKTNTATPALEMVRELFSQIQKIEKERVLINFRGHKIKVGGEEFRADKLMREPAGWLVIIDKLNLI